MKTHLLSLVWLFVSPFLFSQISVNGSQIKDLSDPTEAQDAVTKAYIQSLEEKLNKLQNSLAKKGYFNEDILWQHAEENENNYSTGFINRWFASFSDSYDNTVISGEKHRMDDGYLKSGFHGCKLQINGHFLRQHIQNPFCLEQAFIIFLFWIRICG